MHGVTSDLTSVGYVVVALGMVLGGFVILIRRLGRIIRTAEAIDELAQAQLRQNGGGSLVDKLNKLPGLQSSIDALGDQIRRNHEDAKKQWQRLHERDEDINGRLEVIEQMADSLRTSLPVRLQMQDAMEKRVDSLETRMGRVEHSVFDDDRAAPS